MIYIVVFFVALLLNLYIVIWGKGDLNKLKAKVPLKTYLKELESSLDEMIGDKATTTAKIIAIILCVMIVIFNAILFLGMLVAFILGSFVAKKSYQIPAVSNVLNKIATYINRMR